MRELVRTNDAVMISFITSLLKDSGIEVLVLDQNMSILEGSLGVIPRRIMVEETYLNRARQLLRDADLAEELELDK